ncbi:MAG: methionine synthase [Candidatus Viridilinea halotolerans]|uniref:Methionine synthase n=1 Tax=Candidatus Viridilinea halotolerans TaxID=2491704 RepID=A0A426UA57_9CHLR|nr:MAG: methionine synthase [Candidatus Viridilinea halotolerans]
MSVSERQSPYLAALRQRVLLFDGAMGTSIDTFDLTVEDYGGEKTFGNRDYLAHTRPDVIAAIHASFFEAGADVIETNTFQSSRMRLEEWGLAEQTVELNRAAAALAREVADRFAAQDGRPRFVAGSIGPTGKLPSSDDPALSDITFAELSEVFREQAVGLILGGVDLLIVETSVDILEVKAAIDGIRRAKAELQRPDVAVQAQVFLDLSGRMLLGTDVASFLATLEALPIDVIGLNCSTGPEHMRSAIDHLTSHARKIVSCLPNAGLPLEVDGRTVYPMAPEAFARILGEFVREYGVGVVGGCCGTTPAHIAQLRQELGEACAPKPRQIHYQPSVSSGIRAAALRQEVTLTMIGERVNTLGSRKVKRLLLNDDYDGVLEVAREQVDSGAHMIDVCVAMTERSDEREQMVRLIKKLTMNVELPLVIDTTEPEVLEAALAMYPGRAVVNSVSLEGGRGAKIDQVLPLVARYGAATVAMTIDEVGMTHTRERKLDVAQRIAQIAQDEYGLPAEALIFDVLTFPLTTGQEELRNAAVETIEGIRLVKQQIPGCFTTLGVSNLSFGVAPHARAALNSVFLYHAAAAGLDSAIINPAHITAYAQIPAAEVDLCEDLIFNRREDALARFISHFEQHGASKETERVDPTAGLNVDERLHWKILNRKKEGVEADIDLAVAQRMGLEAAPDLAAAILAAGDDATVPKGEAAVAVLNNVLLPAMKQVGDLFGAGQLILPFVLQSAEVMKKAVAHLEHYLDKLEGSTKGKVVLATVYGDVHDIGKNLVQTILVNNGYTVYDLGKQVPINTIIEKAIEVGADAIGLSALLVSTSKQMPLCVQELHKRGLSFPVLIGGAAINRQYGQRISFVGEEEAYAAGVFYCKDAFEGLETMDRLSDPDQRAQFVDATLSAAAGALNRRATGRVALETLGQAGMGAGDVRSNVSRDVPVPTPPFWGAKATSRIRIDDIVACLDRNALYRLQWGAKNAKGEEWERLKAEFDVKVRDLLREAERDGWLEPKVAYGYFPVQSDGHDLIVYAPAERSQELVRFSFPRQPERERLCLSDYFRSVASGEHDVAVFQVVTMGQRIDELTAALQNEGDYSRSYFIHGLGVSLAEALAEQTNRIVRQSLGLGPNRGKRYAWGYPACPDLAEHTKLFKLLPVDEIGMSLTSAFQLIPEQSTAAIVIHHPEAKYFSIGSAAERAEGDVG